MELESSLFPLRKQELLDHHMQVVNLFSGFRISIWQSTQSTHQLHDFVTLKFITQEFDFPVKLQRFGPLTDGSQIYAHQRCGSLVELMEQLAVLVIRGWFVGAAAPTVAGSVTRL
ncbi:unnamed protein product [Sphagnum jensenii]|uniref:Uncharacterized protein n=1 Tax=Sphagnum jensenii TaxID=128206 RepID=A0ABP1BDB5_9BRYO